MKIQIKSSEVLVLIAAAVMSFLANLPDDSVGQLIDKQALLGGLSALVVVAMFRYLQMMLLLTISILAIGANLPSELATALGISQLALLVSLGIVIAMTLLNRFLNLLPTDKETPAEDSHAEREEVDERLEIMAAIAKGDQATLQRFLDTNVSVNFSFYGTTPLHLAAEKGYPEIVQQLIDHAADYSAKNADGMTALDIALAKKKFIKTTEILLRVDYSYTTNAAA